jgi:hypothetical protein
VYEKRPKQKKRKKKMLRFLDITTDKDHRSIKGNAIGASEYQYYSLINQLCQEKSIVCYNNKGNEILIDNISYKNVKSIIEDEINQEDIIIIQRFLPDLRGKIYEKIKNNKIIVWCHDLVHYDTYIFSFSTEEKNYYKENKEKYKEDVLMKIMGNKNISFVFVSQHLKKLFLSFMSSYNISFEENRLFVIYNILYEEEFIVEDVNVDKNMITYASAWQKGIDHVIKLFSYIFSVDKEIKLNLLSPGYDYQHFISYEKELKEKYGDRIIIHGPVNKEKYSKIIKGSLCVISTTFNETFGCVFAESYFLHTPVIADIRTGAVKEIVDNNFIVNIFDHKLVYEKIKYLQENRDKMHIELDEKFLLARNLTLWQEIIS